MYFLKMNIIIYNEHILFIASPYSMYEYVVNIFTLKIKV